MSDDGYVLAWVEFNEQDHPFSAVTRNAQGYCQIYDLEFSKRFDMVYYHCSGRAGQSFPNSKKRYWLREELEAPESDPALRIEWPMEYPPEKLFNECCQSEVQYCQVCDDWLPSEDNWNLCAHLIWSDAASEMRGTGESNYHSEDRNPHKTSLFYFLDKTQIAEPLLAGLRSGAWRIEGQYYRPDDLRVTLDKKDFNSWYEEDSWKFTQEETEWIEEGVIWLLTLEKGVTTRAEEITCEWLEEYLSLTANARAWCRLQVIDPIRYTSIRYAAKQGFPMRRLKDAAMDNVPDTARRCMVLQAARYEYALKKGQKDASL